MVRPCGGLLPQVVVLPPACIALFSCRRGLARRPANIRNPYCLSFYSGLIGGFIYSLLALTE